MTTIIILAVWLIGIVVSYFLVFKKWEDKEIIDCIFFSLFWPAILAVYCFDCVYQKIRKWKKPDN